MDPLKILAVEPFYGGSHGSFVDGLIRHSSHKIELLHSAAYRWKWRYASSAFRFHQEIKSKLAGVNLFFCSNVFDLFSAMTLVPELRDIAKVVYFHENQATYPVQTGKKRDMHYVLQDLKTIFAADLALFNSSWNMKSLQDNSRMLLDRFPDKGIDLDSLLQGNTALKVQPLGIDLQSLLTYKKEIAPAVPTLLWNHRWEYDKNPALLYKGLCSLQKEKVAFKLIVCGEQKKKYPDVLDQIKREFEDEIVSWGELSRADYTKALQTADISLSTSDHEFFGISVCEAIAAGCVPLLPNRLSYPELLPGDLHAELLYSADSDFFSKLKGLVKSFASGEPQQFKLREEWKHSLRKKVATYDWSVQAKQFDLVLSESYRKRKTAGSCE